MEDVEVTVAEEEDAGVAVVAAESTAGMEGAEALVVEEAVPILVALVADSVVTML